MWLCPNETLFMEIWILYNLYMLWNVLLLGLFAQPFKNVKVTLSLLVVQMQAVGCNTLILNTTFSLFRVVPSQFYWSSLVRGTDSIQVCEDFRKQNEGAGPCFTCRLSGPLWRGTIWAENWRVRQSGSGRAGSHAFQAGGKAHEKVLRGPLAYGKGGVPSGCHAFSKCTCCYNHHNPF